ADIVVSDRPDGSGHVRGVGLARASAENCSGIVEKIVAVHVIDKSVTVIIDSVSGYLRGIRPDITIKIFVSCIYSLIDYPNDNALAALGNVPRLRRANLR